MAKLKSGPGPVPQIFAKTNPLIGVPKGIKEDEVVNGGEKNSEGYYKTSNERYFRKTDKQNPSGAPTVIPGPFGAIALGVKVFADALGALNSPSEKPTSSEIIRGTTIKADHSNDWMSLFGTSVNAQPYIAPGDTNKEIGQQGKTPEYKTQQNNMTDGQELFGVKKVDNTPPYYKRSGVFSSPEMLSFGADVLLSRYKPAYLNVKTGLNVAMDVFRNTEDGKIGIPNGETLSNPHYYSAIAGDLLSASLAKGVGRTGVTTGKYLFNNKGNYIGALKGTGKKLIKKDTYMPWKKSGKQTVAPDESEFTPAGNGPINQAATNTPNKFPTWKEEWKNAKTTSDYGKLYSMKLEGNNSFVTAALLGANVMIDQGTKGKLPGVVKQTKDNVYNTGKSFVEGVNEKLTNYKNQ